MSTYLQALASYLPKLIVERANGVTRIGPLDEIQREAINEELFSAGDLLRIEGLRGEPVVVARGIYA